MNARSRLGRLLAHLALGLFLLASQQHAVAHWLSHAIDATHAKAPGAPASEHCDDCAGLIAFGAALACAEVAIPPTPAFGDTAPVTPLPPTPVAVSPAAYLSRAPPELH